MRSARKVRAFVRGEANERFVVHVPDAVDVRAIDRKKEHILRHSADELATVKSETGWARISPIRISAGRSPAVRTPAPYRALSISCCAAL